MVNDLTIREMLSFSVTDFNFKHQLPDALEARKTLVQTSLENLTQEKIYATLQGLTLIRSDGVQINTVERPQLTAGSFLEGEIFPGATVISDWIFYFNQLSEVQEGDKFILSTDHGDLSFMVNKKQGGFWRNLFK